MKTIKRLYRRLIILCALFADENFKRTLISLRNLSHKTDMSGLSSQLGRLNGNKQQQWSQRYGIICCVPSNGNLHGLNTRSPGCLPLYLIPWCRKCRVQNWTGRVFSLVFKSALGSVFNFFGPTGFIIQCQFSFLFQRNLSCRFFRLMKPVLFVTYKLTF